MFYRTCSRKDGCRSSESSLASWRSRVPRATGTTRIDSCSTKPISYRPYFASSLSPSFYLLPFKSASSFRPIETTIPSTDLPSLMSLISWTFFPGDALFPPVTSSPTHFAISNVAQVAQADESRRADTVSTCENVKEFGLWGKWGN